MGKHLVSLMAVAAAALTVVAVSGAGGPSGKSDDNKLNTVRHIVVIYEENHSFDNLYGGWEGVNGLANADAAHTTQVNQAGTPFQCLYMDDINLQAQSVANPTAPLSTTCNDMTTPTAFPSHFANAPFTIHDYLSPTDTTCPPSPLVAFSSPNGFRQGTGSPGGCTRDIVHRFYEEQFQLNGGQQNRYVLQSDAAGLVMGGYDTKALPDLPVPAPAGPPQVRDPGRLLPGCVRRLVPQPPVVDCGGHARLQRDQRLPGATRPTPCSTATAAQL